MKNLQEQFNTMIENGKIPVFEIPVIDKRTDEQAYILFNVQFTDSQIIAQHEPLTNDEVKSDKIPFKSVNIDEDLDLDSHLAELYDECINSILSSDFFTLTD